MATTHNHNVTIGGGASAAETARLSVRGVVDQRTLYLDDGTYGNCYIKHQSGKIIFIANGNMSQVFGTNGVEKMRIQHTTGNLGINHTVDPAGKLTIGGIDGYTDKALVISSATDNSNYTHEITSAFSSSAGSNYMNFNIASGSGTHQDTVMMLFGDKKVAIGDGAASYTMHVHGTFYSSGSSMDYKQEVQDYKPTTNAIMNLRPVNYEYIDEYKHYGKRLENNSPQIGLVAEEVAEVFPELAVMKEEDGKDVVRNVDYEKLTVVLLSEIQDLRKEVEKLKNGTN